MRSDNAEGDALRRLIEQQDYALIADAVDEYLGFDITTREQQDRITRWAREAALAPLAAPGDASGEPKMNPRVWEALTEEEESIAAAAVPSPPVVDTKERS